MRGFAKWVLVPIAMAAIGYFLIGPRFGGEVAKKVETAGVGEPKSNVPESSSPKRPIPRPGDKAPPPEVETSVDEPRQETPTKVREPIQPRRREGTARRTAPPKPETDEGGSAGAFGKNGN